MPSSAPSMTQSMMSSVGPTFDPSGSPTGSSNPSSSPTTYPSSRAPTGIPPSTPAIVPSEMPTGKPSLSPSIPPTRTAGPSLEATFLASSAPSPATLCESLSRRDCDKTSDVCMWEHHWCKSTRIKEPTEARRSMAPTSSVSPATRHPTFGPEGDLCYGVSKRYCQHVMEGTCIWNNNICQTHKSRGTGTGNSNCQVYRTVKDCRNQQRCRWNNRVNYCQSD